jgi:hypothetical protein
MGDEAGHKAWDHVLATVLRLPGAKLDRASFLRSALAPHCSATDVERAIRTTPAKAGLDPAAIRAAARSAIKWHRAGVTALSFAGGLPGGWWIAGTMPADLAQYFWHLLVVSQKLAYLHEWPSLFADGVDAGDTKLVLTLFVGVMLGVQGAREALGGFSRAAFTKLALYRTARVVKQLIAAGLTRKGLAESIGRAVPLVGGVVAGTFTWVAFGKGCQRLLEQLESDPPS